MSIYTSSRARAHKLEQQSKALGVGNSGTSAATQTGDGRKKSHLEDMARRTTQTAPESSNSGIKASAQFPARGGGQKKSTASNFSGYVPVYGSGGQYTGVTGGASTQTNTGSGRKWYHTAADMANHASGIVLRGVSGLLDGAANLLPEVEGRVMGEEADGTFTGQLLRPVTNLTGQLNDYVVKSTDAYAQRWRDDLADNSKATQMAGELAVSAMAAIPYLATAILSGGGSAVGTITTSAAGTPVLAGAGNAALKQMAADASKQMAANPLWKMRFTQSFGDTYNKAKAKNATELEAITTATMAGYTMATLEQASGIEKILNTKALLDRSGAGRLAQMLASAGTEAAENIGQGATEQIMHKGVYDKQMPLFSAKDTDAVISLPRMGMEAAEGVLFGGSFGIPALVKNGMNTGRLKINVLQQALEQPIITKAHQEAKALTGQMETKLTELGMDTEDLYHITRADQMKLIDRAVDSVLTDEAIGELAAAMEGFDDYKKKYLETSSFSAYNSNTKGIGFQFFAIKSKDFPTITLPPQEYAHVMRELATHLTDEQRKWKVVKKAVGNYVYTIENNGFGDYRVIGKKTIDNDDLEWGDD